LATIKEKFEKEYARRMKGTGEARTATGTATAMANAVADSDGAALGPDEEVRELHGEEEAAAKRKIVGHLWTEAAYEYALELWGSDTKITRQYASAESALPSPEKEPTIAGDSPAASDDEES
jgi:hypothetical protein